MFRDLHDRQTIVYPTRASCPRPVRAPREEEPRPAGDTSTVAELEELMEALDDEHFAGLAPTLRVVFDDGLPGDGQYRHADGVIAVKPGLSRSMVASVLAHELVHAVATAENPDTLRDPHGVAFQAVARIVDPDGAPQTRGAAETWRPAVSVADVPARRRHRNTARQRARTGMVTATHTGSVNDWSRRPDDQSLRFERGQRIPAGHWAVRQAPESFAA